jgi:aspartyl-tRNA(Asn)/glutamyl-tRNA(Gln) amidotransferase subunit B
MSNTYTTTIGLEVHVELKTRTKMFCNSKNDPDEDRPNVNVCPICMGHPGTLPVINKEAVKHVIKVGTAIGGVIADFTEFDRKNYFYPDIPKGYQISQYKYPLVSGGKLHGVEITRVHLEEDTARSSHETGDGSLVDFNRAGLPLMELVTEPVMHSPEEAGNFARELQLLLRTLGVSNANMEKGEMRVEANISVSKTKEFGTKVEVKNINSFKAVERAIAYEVARHIDVLERGEKIAQETRGWDENAQKTFSQRAKEDSHDYRYFPDPDLPKLLLSEIPEFKKEKLLADMPELPWNKRERYAKEFGIKAGDIEVLIENFSLASFFEETVIALAGDKEAVVLAANYLVSDLIGLLKGDSAVKDVFIVPSNISSKKFASLIKMIRGNKVSSRGAKDTLAAMYTEGGEPEMIAEKKGLIQKSDAGELKKMAEEIITENLKPVAEYKAGKESNLQFLIGQAMKKSKGSANPAMMKEIFISLLK